MLKNPLTSVCGYDTLLSNLRGRWQSILPKTHHLRDRPGQRSLVVNHNTALRKNVPRTEGTTRRRDIGKLGTLRPVPQEPHLRTILVFPPTTRCSRPCVKSIRRWAGRRVY